MPTRGSEARSSSSCARGPAALRNGCALFSTDAGHVLFLTLVVDPDESLTDAHHLAGELEEELREQIPGIAEVIVHTEP